MARIDAQLVAARAALETGNPESLLAALRMALQLAEPVAEAARRERASAPRLVVVREPMPLVVGEGM